MLVLQLERALSEFKAGKQILAFQVGKLRHDIFKGIACGQVFEDGLDRITEPADAGLAVANLGLMVMRESKELMAKRNADAADASIPLNGVSG